MPKALMRGYQIFNVFATLDRGRYRARRERLFQHMKQLLGDLTVACIGSKRSAKPGR
jgi:hypothetical protein